MALRWLVRKLSRFQSQLVVLIGSVTILSALIKNIGALAMMMPAALKMAKKSGNSPSLYLMPMAFGSLRLDLNSTVVDSLGPRRSRSRISSIRALSSSA